MTFFFHLEELLGEANENFLACKLARAAQRKFRRMLRRSCLLHTRLLCLLFERSQTIFVSMVAQLQLQLVFQAARQQISGPWSLSKDVNIRRKVTCPALCGRASPLRRSWVEFAGAVSRFWLHHRNC